jgi:hypothetical protein
MKNLWIQLAVICGLMLAASEVAAFSNPTIVENQLGITAIHCANAYCEDKDSLGLWLQLEKYCHADDEVSGDGNGDASKATVTVAEQAPSRRRGRRLSANTEGYYYLDGMRDMLVPLMVGTVCAVSSFVGLLWGLYISGSGKVLIPLRLLQFIQAKTAKSGYQAVPSNDIVVINGDESMYSEKEKVRASSSRPYQHFQS